MAKEPKAGKEVAAKSAAPKEPKADKEPKAPKESKKVDARLRHVYKDSVIHALVKEFCYKNVMGVPKVEKGAIMYGLGEATQKAKLMSGAVIALNAIDYRKVEKAQGMNISITTTAKTDAEGVALLKHMGMPFRQ